MKQRTKVEPIPGFHDSLPDEQLLFQEVLTIIREEYERFGFSPIETPALERLDTFNVNGGNEDNIYAICSPPPIDEHRGQEDLLALHFDLTVPLARFVMAHYAKLSFPFRRYQIQKVWRRRGEKLGSKLYCEFYQCDFDVIGEGKLSLLTDAEVPSIIYSVFRALNNKFEFGDFVINISNRKILQGLLADYEEVTQNLLAVLRTLGTLRMVGRLRVIRELQALGMKERDAKELLRIIDRQDMTNEALLAELEHMQGNEMFATGVRELKTVIERISDFGVPKEYVQIDLTIARNFGYYTGTVYETLLRKHKGLGSICSGGRYDDLTAQFTQKSMPGVGAAIYLGRLLLCLNQSKTKAQTPAPVLITTMLPEKMDRYLGFAQMLRQDGIKTEVYLEEAPLKVQMRYAEQKGIKIVLIANETELADDRVTLKNLRSGGHLSVHTTVLVQNVHDQIEAPDR